MAKKEYEHKAINAELVMVDFDTDIPKRAGGSYQGTNIVYKAFNKVNEKGFTTKTFEFKPELRSQLEALSPKDKFTLNMYKEKDSKFWNVDSVAPGHVQQHSPSSTPAQGSAPSFDSNAPNPAAVGQVLNLALDLKLVSSIDELFNPVKAREVVAKVKAAKEAIASVWNEEIFEEDEKAKHSSHSHTQELNDDIPF